MATTTTRDGMRKALDALRTGRDPGIAGADFILQLGVEDFRKPGDANVTLADYGVLPGDHVEWKANERDFTYSVRVILREEAPSFVDLMAA